MKKFGLLQVICAIAVASCKVDEPAPPNTSPSLSVSPHAIDVAPSAPTQKIEITTKSNWSVTASQAWIHLASSSGTGNFSLSFSIDDNPTAGPRQSTITVRAEGVPN